MKSLKSDLRFVAWTMLLTLIAALVVGIFLAIQGGVPENPAAAQSIPVSGAQPAGAGPLTQSAQDGQTLFQEKCVACHTIGGGILVGPDLQGVTARRERDWLARWIQAPDKMLAEGDPLATQLLQEFNNVPMPNLGLTGQQVEALIAYLESLEAGTAAPLPAAIPSLYYPTLIAALIALGGLTAVGLLAANKRVEVRL